jgi:glycosyltransferase involved in cell wall biosynthesis
LPLISFCIPFYTGLDYLKEAVASVRSQSISDWEIIVIDDCGPDAKAQAWLTSLSDKRVQYVRNEKNLGLAGNWNRCLQMANSELVTLLHADDKLEPSYAERMLETASRFPDITAFFCRARIINEKSEATFSFPDFIKGFIMPSRDQPLMLQGEPALAQLLKGVFIFCPTLCFRKSRLADRYFSSDWRMVLDLEILARLLMDGDILYGLPDKLYNYRRHSQNQTSILTNSLTRFEEEVSIYRAISQQCLKRSWLNAHKIARRMLIIKLNLLYCLAKNIMRVQLHHALLTIKFINRSWLLPSN